MYENKLREKTCGKKIIYRHKSFAEKIAKKFNHKVYECPICMCFHTTSKIDWKNDYVHRDEYEKALQQIAGLKRLKDENLRLGKQIHKLNEVISSKNNNIKLLKEIIKSYTH